MQPISYELLPDRSKRAKKKYNENGVRGVLEIPSGRTPDITSWPKREMPPVRRMKINESATARSLKSFSTSWVSEGKSPRLTRDLGENT